MLTCLLARPTAWLPARPLAAHPLVRSHYRIGCLFPYLQTGGVLSWLLAYDKGCFLPCLLVCLCECLGLWCSSACLLNLMICLHVRKISLCLFARLLLCACICWAVFVTGDDCMITYRCACLEVKELLPMYLFVIVFWAMFLLAKRAVVRWCECPCLPLLRMLILVAMLRGSCSYTHVYGCECRSIRLLRAM